MNSRDKGVTLVTPFFIDISTRLWYDYSYQSYQRRGNYEYT